MAESTLPLIVLHEDENLLAVDKSPGEPVIAPRGDHAGACLVRRLERARGERLFVVHRIDRDVSGVVVFARNAEAHRALSMAFERRRVLKTYSAFVTGSPPGAAGRLDIPLHAARRGKARPALPGEPGQQAATTDYRVRRRWRLGDEVVTLLEARPLTGRHHQIRVHLRAQGTPLLFDPLYGRGRVPAALAQAPCARLALHARQLILPSPRGAGALILEAPLASDLAALEIWLDAHGAPEGGPP